MSYYLLDSIQKFRGDADGGLSSPFPYQWYAFIFDNFQGVEIIITYVCTIRTKYSTSNYSYRYQVEIHLQILQAVSP